MRRYLILVLAITALKGALAIVLPVSGDEAEYWDCSRHLAWSYLDHTPLLFWAMIPFRVLLGETALAVRMPSIVSGLLVGLMIPPLVRRLGGSLEDAERSWLAVNAMPLFFFGSFYSWTDSPMLTAFVAITWAAVTVAQGEARAWWGFGVALGLGFLAKITVVLALAAIIPLIASSKVRSTLRTAHPWFAALASLVLTTPFWIWGAQHDWINITFQLQQRHTRSSVIDPMGAVEFLGTNLLLATPFLFAAAMIALCRSWKTSESSRPLVAAAVAPLVVFTLVSMRSRPGAHWAAPVLILGAILAGVVSFRGRRALIIASSVMCAAISIAVVAISLAPEKLLAIDWSYARSPVRVSPKYLVYALGNQEIADEVARRLAPGEMMASENYTHAHLLAFLGRGRFETRLAWMKKRAVSGLPSLYWYAPGELRGRDFLFITEKRGFDDDLRRIFETVAEEAPIEIRRRGELLRSIRVLRCRNLLEPRGTFTLLE